MVWKHTIIHCCWCLCSPKKEFPCKSNLCLESTKGKWGKPGTSNWNFKWHKKDHHKRLNSVMCKESFDWYSKFDIETAFLSDIYHITTDYESAGFIQKDVELDSYWIKWHWFVMAFTKAQESPTKTSIWSLLARGVEIFRWVSSSGWR